MLPGNNFMLEIAIYFFVFEKFLECHLIWAGYTVGKIILLSICQFMSILGQKTTDTKRCTADGLIFQLTLFGFLKTPQSVLSH